MTSKLYLIDGSGFIFRAFHALPPLTRPDGVPVGAVYGFCNMLLKLLGQIQKSDHLAVIFDAGRKTFRNEIYTAYKAHRPELPEALIPQFGLIREVCEAFNVPSVELEGFEADDLIATYARLASHQNNEVVIVSSDKDLMQLVGKNVTMLDPIKNKPIGVNEVIEKFGVPPEKVIDVQALAGDSADNVPGVPGIGIKTAAELITTYGDLEALLERVSEIKQPKRREVLTNHAEDARLSKLLVTLHQEVPLPMPLDDLVPKPMDRMKVNEFLRFQGFNSLVARMDKQAGEAAIAAAPTLFPLPEQNKPKEAVVQSIYTTIETSEQLNAWIAEATKLAVIAIDTETTSVNAVQAQLVGISMALAKGKACYIPLAHREDRPQLNLKETIEALRPLFVDPSVLKIGHNIKYDLTVFKNVGLDVSPIGDTMLMSYVLDSSKNGHGMDELAERHLGYQTIKFSDVAGTGKSQVTFDYVPIDQATPYAAEDADVTLQLYELFKQRLFDEKMLTVYERIERPLIPVIASMEQWGIRIADDQLTALGKEFFHQMIALETEIYGLAGREFNVGSPKQLGEILFDELGLPAPKKTKTGAYVTDVDVLEKLAVQGHPLPAKILEWRGLSKLKSTYVDALISALNPVTGRVHTSYSMAVAATGRLASSDPNLQNIPIRTENGRKIRHAFIAASGYKLVSLDYSQIELRLLAHMADVPALVESFKKGIDIHTATAGQMFNIPIEQVDALTRRRAKAINFGIIYGISAFGLSQQLGVPQGEASAYIKAYFEKYPGIQDYMERCRAFAREHGYVTTLFGRKCYTMGIMDQNVGLRQFAERQAINAPLQGSNADIIKQAMDRVPAVLEKNKLGARLLLQVHDELLFEVPESEVEKTVPVLKGLMENIVSLKVPLVVGVGIGDNWEEAH